MKRDILSLTVFMILVLLFAQIHSIAALSFGLKMLLLGSFFVVFCCLSPVIAPRFAGMLGVLLQAGLDSFTKTAEKNSKDNSVPNDQAVEEVGAN